MKAKKSSILTGPNLFVLAALLVPALLNDPFLTHLFTRAATYSIVVMGLTLFIGYTGQISLGHAAFFGLAGYISGILSKIGLPFMISAAGAVALVGCIGLIVGIMVLHTKGNYLALASIAVGIIVEVLIKNLDWTGGPTGLTGIPAASLFGFDIPGNAAYYYMVLVLATAGFLVLRRLTRSRIGDALLAIANNEIAAESLGINVFRYKILSFTISTIYAAIAGVLVAHYDNYMSPDLLNLKTSILFFVMAYIGGIGNIWGSVIGALFLTLLSEYTQDFGDYNVLIYGVLLALIIRFLPHGLCDLPNQIKRLRA